MLQAIRVPTLVLVGEQDYMCTKSSRLLAQTIPGATLQLIKNSGHMAPLEQPAAFSAAVLEFLGAAGPQSSAA